MIPVFARFSFWPKLITGVVLAGLIGWGVRTVYSSIYDRGYDRGIADTRRAEHDCIEGSVCAAALDARAAKQRQIVADAQEAGRKRAEKAAAEQLAQEVTAREAAEGRATAARAAASAAQRRYLKALTMNQACSAWSAQEVPCPIE